MTMTTTDKSNKKVEKWPGYYRCDDLYPPICDDDLTVTRGRVETLTGISISYYAKQINIHQVSDRSN